MIVWGVTLALAAWGGYYLFWRYHAKRMFVVHEGMLIRMGQPTEFGLQHLAQQYGIRTVLSLQLADYRLSGGLYDPGHPSGRLESDFVAGLGIHHLQWPMGDEACWPWLTPWQFEEFFRVFDRPEDLPVAVHCMGGRHRTGTFSALFRLEYDRWPVDKTLAEMYSFEFGPPVPMQEHNLRTYLPRAAPDAATCRELLTTFGPLLGSTPPTDYADLVRGLKNAKDQGQVQAALRQYVDRNGSFALPLMVRLLEQPNDPLAAPACELASATLEKDTADEAQWSAAAMLVADFGTIEQQQRLLKQLVDESRQPTVTRRYAAIVAGVTNRYTPNRLAYLRPLLEDERNHLEPQAARYRYCDTAVVRLAAIRDQWLMLGNPDKAGWDEGRKLARAWFDDHPADLEVCQLLPPDGRNMVRSDNAPQRGDVSRRRR
jgi:hypothetical protein